MVSGKRSPPDDGREYQVQFRNGFVDDKHKYTARQLKWKHEGHDFDVVAVMAAIRPDATKARPTNGSYT